MKRILLFLTIGAVPFVMHGMESRQLEAGAAEARIACDECEKTFTTRGNMQQHKQQFHEGRRFHCDYPDCKAEYTRKEQLKIHKYKHTGEKPYICDVCIKEYSDPAHLRNHKRSAHRGEDSRVEHVVVEGAIVLDTRKEASEKENIGEVSESNEIATESSAKKTHVCQYCSKTWDSPYSLKRHELSHTGERPYVCRHCKKTFRDDSYFRVHKREHKSGKAHVCDYPGCTSAFSFPSALQVHIRQVHTDKEKPAYTVAAAAAADTALGKRKADELVGDIPNQSDDEN